MIPGIVYSWSRTIPLDELEMYQFFAILSELFSIPTISFLTKKKKKKKKMASPISCLSILVIPLLLTSLFYHVSNAD